MNGWKASENAASWKVVDGTLAAEGPRSHLFYTGPVHNADFRNFELKAEFMTRQGSNSGIYFHSAFQEKGWPAKGFEVQINNTHVGEGTYRERKKTGSLYGIRNMYMQLAKDDVWNEMYISVRGKQVQIRLNGNLLVDYIEPEPPLAEGDSAGRVLDHGTFALQGHDPGSKSFFRNIRVKVLPDDLRSATPPTAPDATYRELQRLGRENYPVVDYHLHLKGGLTLEEALAESRRVGIQYGIAVNCGKNFPITNDAGILDFLKSMQGQPVFIAMQAEGREWTKMFSKEAVAKFDYVFTDSMTWSDNNGKRMRLWIPEEVGTIKDKQAFMDLLVERTVGILNNEPVDIYVNPTFIPDQMQSEYDQLWTPDRMQKVIDAAKENGVAVEINNRYRIPHAAFIKKAKEAGVRFTCGTNNTDRTVGRMEYCLEMVKECDLRWQDMWTPKPDGQKPVQRKGL